MVKRSQVADKPPVEGGAEKPAGGKRRATLAELESGPSSLSSSLNAGVSSNQGATDAGSQGKGKENRHSRFGSEPDLEAPPMEEPPTVEEGEWRSRKKIATKPRMMTDEKGIHRSELAPKEDKDSDGGNGNDTTFSSPAAVRRASSPINHPSGRDRWASARGGLSKGGEGESRAAVASSSSRRSKEEWGKRATVRSASLSSRPDDATVPGCADSPPVSPGAVRVRGDNAAPDEEKEEDGGNDNDDDEFIVPTARLVLDDESSSSASSASSSRSGRSSPSLPASVQRDRVKLGLCPRCGVRLFNVRREGIEWISTRKVYRPLTTPGEVFEGRCLRCHPVLDAEVGMAVERDGDLGDGGDDGESMEEVVIHAPSSRSKSDTGTKREDDDEEEAKEACAPCCPCVPNCAPRTKVRIGTLLALLVLAAVVAIGIGVWKRYQDDDGGGGGGSSSDSEPSLVGDGDGQGQKPSPDPEGGGVDNGGGGGSTGNGGGTDDPGSALVCPKDPFPPDVFTSGSKLTSGTGSSPEFGSSVSVDGGLIVVGSPSEDGQKGAAYAFDATDTAKRFKLIAGDGSASDRFGASVSVSGSTVVIGAPSDDSGSGSAYVFERAGSSWNFHEKVPLKPEGLSVLDRFGFSVLARGDKLLVGAPAGDGGEAGAGGAVHVYSRSGGGWTHSAVLAALDASGGDRFGSSLAMSGSTVVIGAANDHRGGTGSGSAYVFVEGVDGWSQQAKLVAHDARSNGHFGVSVAIDGNVVLVGADGNNGVSIDGGAVYVYLRSGSIWQYRTKWTFSGGEAGLSFGRSVAFAGGGGILVGAPRFAADCGSAHLLKLSPGWDEMVGSTLYITGSSVGKNNYGSSIAVSSKIAIVGAPAGSGLDGSAHIINIA